MLGTKASTVCSVQFRARVDGYLDRIVVGVRKYVAGLLLLPVHPPPMQISLAVASLLQKQTLATAE